MGSRVSHQARPPPRVAVSYRQNDRVANDSTNAAPLDVPWKARFRAARMTLPDWAVLRPDRNVFVSNVSGTFEMYRWDRSDGTSAQVTARPAGTRVGTIDPAGDWIWWFDDDGGNEFGVWRRQRFEADAGAPTAEVAVPGLLPSYPSGLCLGQHGLAIVGRSTDEGASIYVAHPGGDPVVVYSHEQDAGVIALSRDDSLLAIEHSEHGDSRHMALRVVRVADGSTVADKWDGVGRGVAAVAFAPIEGDTRLLARHERQDRWTPFIWDVADDTERALALDLPGDVSAQWFADASALLIAHEYQARSSLYRYDLATNSLEQLEIPAGTISGATARPDGTIEFLWSSGAQAPALRDSAGQVVFTPPGPVAPESVPVEDAWVEGQGGLIHALVSKPAGAVFPVPTVFLVHGGPAMYDADAFSPGVAAWVDAGFAVVRVNYRGSTGYVSCSPAVRGVAISPCSASARSPTRGRSALPGCRWPTMSRSTKTRWKGYARTTARCSAAAPTRYPTGIGSRRRSPTSTTWWRRCSSWPAPMTHAARSARSTTTLNGSPHARHRSRSTGSTPATVRSWSRSASSRPKPRSTSPAATFRPDGCCGAAVRRPRRTCRANNAVYRVICTTTLD